MLRNLNCVPVKRMAALLGAIALTGSMIGAPKADTSEDPFKEIRGKWGGSGVMSLSEGRKERLACSAEYSGSSSLRLVIDCSSKNNKINLQAKLSSNAGRLAGTWSEKTYNVLGVISGKMTDNKISFNIAGGVLVRMSVSYTKTRQRVNISVQNLPLKDVSINMTRR